MTTRHRSHRSSPHLHSPEQHPHASTELPVLPNGDGDDLVDLVVVVRSWGLPIAVAMVVGALVGWYWAGQVPLWYESEATVLVGPVVPNSDLLEGTADLARTYGEIVESDSVIALAAEDAGLNAGDVAVSAQAGRGSATLTIRVRTPSGTTSPLMTSRLVDELRDIVADNRALVPASSWGTVQSADDATAGAQPVTSFPIGASITVIDDGARATKTSLDPAQGAVLGALASGLLVVVVALTVESRRRARSRSGFRAGVVCDDLGTILGPPVLGGLLRSPRWRTIARDQRARTAIQPAVDAVWLCAIEAAQRDGNAPVVAVIVPTASRRCLAAFWQLCDGLSSTVVVLDPTGAGVRWLSGDEELGTQRADVVVDGTSIGSVLTGDIQMGALDRRHVTVVLVPGGESLSAWWPVAQHADGVVALMPESNRTSSPLAFGVERLRRHGVPLLGVVGATRRWFGPPAALVGLIPEDAVSQDEVRPEPVERRGGI